jgi:hypothetical protein
MPSGMAPFCSIRGTAASSMVFIIFILSLQY